MIRSSILCVVISINTLLSHAQKADYPQLFGKDWDAAIEFVSKNSNRFDKYLNTNEISKDLAIAIIFPELIRYSALRNKMEVGMLKTLYVYKGAAYANFSVGHFQMKPSFAQQVLAETKRYRIKWANRYFRDIYKTNDSIAYRRKIVAMLDNFEGQAILLVAFIKICDLKYGLNEMVESDRVKIYSTAYNGGIHLRYDQLMALMRKKHYHIGFKSSKELFSYADISHYYWLLEQTNRNN